MQAFPPTHIYATGKHKDKHLAAVEADYLGRLGSAVTLNVTNPPVTVRGQQQAEAFYAGAFRRDAVVLALDEGGTTMGSQAFSQLLSQIAGSARTPVFLIGGDAGLFPEHLKQAQYRLAFGAMTWPHLLARVLLLEQLYRAQCILRGHPYHREGARA